MNNIENKLNTIYKNEHIFIKMDYKLILYNKNEAIIIYIFKNILKKEDPNNNDIKKAIKKIIKDISDYSYYNNKYNKFWEKLKNCIIIINDDLYNNFLLKRIEDGFIINIKESEFHENIDIFY